MFELENLLLLLVILKTAWYLSKLKEAISISSRFGLLGFLKAVSRLA